MLSIVIPAHNEARRISPLLKSLRRVFSVAEIIVVANACTDDTAEIVRRFAAHDSSLRLIDIESRLGKGGAVRLGFHAARGDVIAFIDADGATPAEELRRLVSELRDSDCVIASRWATGARVLVRQPPLRRFLGRAFNVIVRAMFGLRLADTQCGAKIFRRAALEEIIEDVETADFAFDVDLLYQLQRRGRSIRESPTVWRDREGSTVDVLTTGPRMLASIARLRLSHSPCRYVIPFFDHLFGIRAIKSRRRIRFLVVGDERKRVLGDDIIGKFKTLLETYKSEYREVVWWTPKTRRAAAIEYLRVHRSKFDCIIEIASNGDRYWTPLFTFKPIIIISPTRQPPRWPYAAVEHLDSVPNDSQGIECAVLRALTRRDAYFLQETDGSWTFQPRLPNPDRTFSKPVREPVTAASTVALGS